MKVKILFILLTLTTLFANSQTQLEMNADAKIAYEKADAEMSKLYFEVMKNLPTQKEKDDLLSAQRAWIEYKELHCQAAANQFEGGSIMPLIYYSCLEELTIERKKHLLSCYIEN